MASVFKCVNSSDLNALKAAAKAYGKMGTLGNVKEAANIAGGKLRDQMKRMVDGESSLAGYRDVGAAITVFEDANNIVVGVPPNDPLIDRAWEMHGTYQLKDVAEDLARQSGDIEQTFHDELAAGVS